MEKKASSNLTIPNDLSYGPIVGSYVKAVAKKIGFNDDEQQMIELGVDEAFTNVVEHAFEPDEEASFDIVCERIPLGLKVILKEKGLPFDPSRIPEYDPDADLEERSGAGLGYFFMKEAMDEVSFHNLGKEGKETLLVKYLQRKNIKDYFDESELKRYEKSDEKTIPPEEKIEFGIRRMKPGEAIEVSKCIYKTYGYSYDKEHAYFPERIVELNENGLMSSVVAVTPDGEVAGHCALLKKHPDDTIGEVGMAVVKPKFRGQGCLKQLSSYRMDEAREQGLVGVFGQGVSTHPYSQRAMHKFGFNDCTILLANVPTTRSFKAIAETISQRESYVIAFQYLKEPRKSAVYPPPHHWHMIERIYQNLGWMPTFVDQEESEGSSIKKSTFAHEEGVIKTNVTAAKGIAYISVIQYGADTGKKIREQLKDLCLKRIEVMYLYLDLHNPFTQRMSSRFEDMGFFFGGVFPGQASGNDALVLQYLNNVPMDYGKIAVDSEFAQQLKNYIEKHDPNKAG